MKVELSEEQVNQFVSDEYMDIDAGNYRFYFEIDKDTSGKLRPSYFEISMKGAKGNFKPVAHNVKELRKLEPLKPADPSWHHNDPLCPSCRSYMLYKYEHCPKCGQKLDWSE